MNAALVALLALLCAPAARAEDLPAGEVAFFGVQFVDMSTEGAVNGPRADEAARTEMASAYVARDMAGRGFELVPVDPVADRLKTVANPSDCNGCDIAMAQELGADYALTGEVVKVSNLILSLKLNLRDAETGQTLRAGTVDIRGNTDESWQRGFRYLIRHLIFRE